MTKDKNTNKYYRQTSFPLATYLFAKNQQISGISPTDKPSQKEFVFVSTARLEELVETYLYAAKDHPDLQINVRDYEAVRRQLLDRLHSG